MHLLYCVAQIRDIEEAAAAQLAPGTLMQRAGRAAANAALQLLASQSAPCVLVLAGPGNNGGDALEVAANLALAGLDVAVLSLPASLPSSPERAHALARARSGAARFIDALPAAPRWALVVDGLFGIGLKRPLDGAALELAGAVNALDCPVLALDVPSGLDADTGALVGSHGAAVRASHTITFIGNKPGLHTCEGRDYAGTVWVAPLEIDALHFPPASAELNRVALFAPHLSARAQNSHKGSFGNVAVVGGARGMAGAPVLAARAALLTGAGRVYVAGVDAVPACDPIQLELMMRGASEFDFASATLAVGPGLGNAPDAARLVRKAIDSHSALVLDADALNLVAGDAPLQAQLAQRAGLTVLTPHPLEAARLLGVTCAVVQADRLAAARELADRLSSTVVLKGSGSVIAAPGGAVVINTSGNPGLATAGTGDVLAGMCASLLAQGWPEWEAALAAVWMHGTAADRLVAQGIGPIGLTAGELPAAARSLLNELVNASSGPGRRPQSSSSS